MEPLVLTETIPWPYVAASITAMGGALAAVAKWGAAQAEGRRKDAELLINAARDVQEASKATIANVELLTRAVQAQTEESRRIREAIDDLADRVA